jgi:GNAT superfamily N-acetyltransferase
MARLDCVCNTGINVRMPLKLLQPADYSLVMPLLTGIEHDLAVQAVVAGDAGGRIYAPVGAPEWALVSPHWGRLFVIGRTGARSATELRALLDGAIWPAARRAGASVYTLAYPMEWDAVIPEALSGKRTKRADRQYYRWSGGPLPHTPVPPGFSFVPADRSLMQDRPIAKLQLLAEEMASERASIDDFLARGFGLAALSGGELAGWCLSEYNSGARCEVGIASLEPFQRKGLATAMGRQFLSLARDHGILEVGWHCWKSNTASAASALKIGLDHAADYKVYIGWYNEQDAPE